MTLPRHLQARVVGLGQQEGSLPVAHSDKVFKDEPRAAHIAMV
jgi:hypothetical protein